MASNRIFNSSSDGEVWVQQIIPFLSNPEGFRYPPASIFVVPKTLSAVNPEAYTPRVIGMGPHHHLRPDLYAQEGDKLELAKSVLLYIPTLTVKDLFTKLLVLDPEIRKSYKEFLDLSPVVLALIIAIDGLFLLGILKKIFFVGARKLKLGDIHGDLFMLENQIPIDLLRGIINPSDGGNYSSSPGADQLDHQDLESGEEISLSPSILVDFCKEHCPLEFDEQRASYLAGDCKHLLDLMYSSIVDFHGLQYPRPRMLRLCADIYQIAKDTAEVVGCLDPIFDVLPYGVLIRGLLQSLLQIIQGMPWDRIFLLFRKPSEDDAKSKSQDIKIPSASQLSSVGVKINLAPKIQDIQFDEEGAKPKLYLPLITLNVTSKVVLRNLVAYEASIALPHAKCELALYAFLMSGIISAAVDVELLKAEGVVKVKGDLSSAEVADIFRGMCRPTTQPDEKSKLEETIETVYKFYNSKWKVKASKFARASGRVLKIVLTVLVISAICLKLICNAFDCPRISWKSPSALNLALQFQ